MSPYYQFRYEAIVDPPSKASSESDVTHHNDWIGGKRTNTFTMTDSWFNTYGYRVARYDHQWNASYSGSWKCYLDGVYHSQGPAQTPLMHFEKCNIEYFCYNEWNDIFYYCRDVDARKQLITDPASSLNLKWLYRIDASAYENNGPLWSPPGEIMGTPSVPFSQISVLGTTLNSQGYIYKQLAQSTAYDITAVVNDEWYYYSVYPIAFPQAVVIRGHEDGTGYLDAMVADVFDAMSARAYARLNGLQIPTDLYSNVNWGVAGAPDGHAKILPFYQILYMIAHGSDKTSGIGIIDELTLSAIPGLKNEVPTGNSYLLLILHACNSARHPFKAAFGASTAIGWNYNVKAPHVNAYDMYFWDRLSSGVGTYAANLYAATLTAAWTALDGAVPVHDGPSQTFTITW